MARANPCAPYHYSPSCFYHGAEALLTYCEYHPCDVKHFCLEADDNVVVGSGSPRDGCKGQHSRDGDGIPLVVVKWDCMEAESTAVGNLTSAYERDVVPVEMTPPWTPLPLAARVPRVSPRHHVVPENSNNNVVIIIARKTPKYPYVNISKHKYFVCNYSIYLLLCVEI